MVRIKIKKFKKFTKKYFIQNILNLKLKKHHNLSKMYQIYNQIVNSV